MKQGSRANMSKKLSKNYINFFLYFSLVFSAFPSFTNTFSSMKFCESIFSGLHPSLPPLNVNDIAAVRIRLQTHQDIGGSATLSIAQPFSPEISQKLRTFLLEKEGGGIILSGDARKSLLQSGVFSVEEINAMDQGLNQYFEQIKQLIFQVDARDVVLDGAFLTTEKTAPIISHTHPLGGDRNWISATHALIGHGTWYEAIHKNEHQHFAARTGETLLLSEPYRMASLSGIPERLLDGYLADYHDFPHPFRAIARKQLNPIEGPLHGSSRALGGKRLMVISTFKLKGSFKDSAEK